METKLSSKGQVVIPQTLRESRGWVSGQRFEVQTSEGSVVLTPIPDEAPVLLDELIGCVDYQGPKKTVEEMNAGVRARFKKRGA